MILRSLALSNDMGFPKMKRKIFLSFRNQMGKKDLRKFQISQEPRVIESDTTYHHPIHIHLCQMTSNLKMLKYQKFLGVVGESQGTENLSSNFREPYLEKYTSDNHASCIKIRVKCSSLQYHAISKNESLRKFFWEREGSGEDQSYKAKNQNIENQAWPNQIWSIITLFTLTSIKWHQVCGIRKFKNWESWFEKPRLKRKF